jgi:hypothetical protein
VYGLIMVLVLVQSSFAISQKSEKFDSTSGTTSDLLLVVTKGFLYLVIYADLAKVACERFGLNKGTFG